MALFPVPSHEKMNARLCSLAVGCFFIRGSKVFLFVCLEKQAVAYIRGILTGLTSRYSVLTSILSDLSSFECPLGRGSRVGNLPNPMNRLIEDELQE